MKSLPQPKLVQDEFLDTFGPGQAEPYEAILPVPTDLEPEERAALPFHLDPFDQLPGANLCGVYLERIAVRQLTPFLDRAAERLDEPSVARPLLRRYSFDVAGEFRLCRLSGLLRCGSEVHKR